jgi:AraC family transcriptional regulator, regulatory protein of adaptative response / DNA-3-methyladenine glycosylase II
MSQSRYSRPPARRNVDPVPATPMYQDVERCVRAVQSKDARFDGFFFTAVVTTGIYCRPSCPVVPPKPTNMRFYPTAAAAQGAGFRACKRCRPDATPGSPEWDLRGDAVGRAMRLIADGVVDREGVPGLAARVGYQRRQLERHCQAELGAGPLALARAQRAQTARLLIETTDLPLSQVAFAAGFGSVRQFNDTIQSVFALSPTTLRQSATKPTATKSPAARGAAKTPAPKTPAASPMGTASREPPPSPTPRVGGSGEGDRSTGSGFPLRNPVAPDRERPRQAPAATRSNGEAAPADRSPKGEITVKLPFRHPLEPSNLFGHLSATAIPGIEEWRDGAYRRTLRLPHGPGIVSLTPGDAAVTCTLSLHDLRDLSTAIARCRRLLDLDADPVAVDAALQEDPALAEAVRAVPGRRVPRTVDEEEMAIRAVIGQQISTAAARTHAARLAEQFGDEIADPAGGLNRLWPETAALAEVDPTIFAMPESRRDTLVALIRALEVGKVSLAHGVDRDAARSELQQIKGIGPWTIETIALRALGDPDAFPATDLGVRQGAARLGLPDTPAALIERAQRWSPWRAYAVAHLTGHHATNELPRSTP